MLKLNSKLIPVLMTLYMASVLVFSTSTSLNRYSQLIYILTFGTCAAILMLNKVHFKFDAFLGIMALFIIFCMFGLFWAKSQPAAYEKISTLIQLFIMSMVLFNYFINTKKTSTVISAIFISGIISSLYILSYYGISGYIKMLTDGERAGVEITNVNSIGMYMAFTVIIGFYYAYIEKRKISYLLIILPFIMSLGSGSRKALLTIAIGIILIIFMDYAKKVDIEKIFKIFFIAIVFVIFAMWISSLPIFNTVFERFDSMLASGAKKEHSAYIREKMIEIGWKYFLEHPFTGCGIGNSFYITLKGVGRNTYLHNNFIELLASVGIIGFTIYYSIYIYILSNLYKIYKKTNEQKIGIILILIFIRMIMDYGMVSYYDKMTSIDLTVAAAEIYIFKIRKKEEIVVQQNIEGY